MFISFLHLFIYTGFELDPDSPDAVPDPADPDADAVDDDCNVEDRI